MSSVVSIYKNHKFKVDLQAKATPEISFSFGKHVCVSVFYLYKM